MVQNNIGTYDNSEQYKEPIPHCLDDEIYQIDQSFDNISIDDDDNIIIDDDNIIIDDQIDQKNKTKKKPRCCGKCGEHGHFNDISKGNPCPNTERVNKKKEEEKRLKKEEKRLKVKGGGTTMKGRDGSTRHGAVNSFSNYHAYKPTIEDLNERNETFNIKENECFYCKKKLTEKEEDHMISCCNTTEGIYGQRNALNIVPCCKKCNNQKNKKPPVKFIKANNEIQEEWRDNKIQKLEDYLNENKSKLKFSGDNKTYIEEQFPIINKFHEIGEYCIKNKLSIKKELLKSYSLDELKEELRKRKIN